MHRQPSDAGRAANRSGREGGRAVLRPDLAVTPCVGRTPGVGAAPRAESCPGLVRHPALPEPKKNALDVFLLWRAGHVEGGGISRVDP